MPCEHKNVGVAKFVAVGGDIQATNALVMSGNCAQTEVDYVQVLALSICRDCGTVLPATKTPVVEDDVEQSCETVTVVSILDLVESRLVELAHEGICRLIPMTESDKEARVIFNTLDILRRTVEPGDYETLTMTIQRCWNTIIGGHYPDEVASGIRILRLVYKKSLPIRITR